MKWHDRIELLKYKSVHLYSNLSCHNRYLTLSERYLIYHTKPITQVSQPISSAVSNINQQQLDTETT